MSRGGIIKALACIIILMPAKAVLADLIKIDKDTAKSIRGGVATTTSPGNNTVVDFDNPRFTINLSATGNAPTNFFVYAGDSKGGYAPVTWSGSAAPFTAMIDRRFRWPVEWHNMSNTQARYFACVPNSSGGCDGGWLDSSARPFIRLNETKIRSTHKIIFWILGTRDMSKMDTGLVTDDTSTSYSTIHTYSPDAMFAQCWNYTAISTSRRYEQFREHKTYSVTLPTNLTACGNRMTWHTRYDGQDNIQDALSYDRMNCGNDDSNSGGQKFDELVNHLRGVFSQDSAHAGRNWNDFIHVFITDNVRYEYDYTNWTNQPRPDISTDVAGIAVQLQYWMAGYGGYLQPSRPYVNYRLIIMRDGDTQKQFQNILSHEIGHHMGLAHVDDYSMFNCSTSTNPAVRDLMCAEGLADIVSDFDCTGRLDPTSYLFSNFFFH